jgi:hypothetical protein
MGKQVSKATRTRILNLVKAGKVKFAEHLDFKKIQMKRVETPEERREKFENPVFTHVSFSHGWRKWRKKGFTGSNGGCIILWAVKGIGGGELTIKLDTKGRLCLNTETMGREFSKKILCALVDAAKTDRKDNS